ncbi:hypothetical protein [Niveispirillum fermenti]|uniref:hypothetical protein n=1 Tax=Niveispirillum fermenti TaxID=1233113 RepID=UPI003A8680A5
MSTDRFGGPSSIAAIKAAGAGQQAAQAGLGATPRPPAAMAMQAGVLARPPDMPLHNAVTVTGVLGAATPDGDLPLTTSSGTLLLRPVQGAWPSDLPAGSTLSVTVGPGARAGNVQAQAMAAPERTGQAASPGARPPAIGAEQALRGLLAAGGDAIIRTGAAARPAAAGTAAAGATPVAAPAQVAAAPASNPQLVASAGAVLPPRVGPVIAAAATAAPDAPRAAAAAQSAQAVADIGKGARAGTQDLQQQAALQPQNDATGPRRPAAPLASPPLPDLPAMAGAQAARPDLILAQSLAHPGMVARMAAFLPRPDRLGGVALLLYLFGARNGGVRAWLGEEQVRHLTRSEAKALAGIEEAMTPAPRLASDGSVWSTLLVPFMDGDRPSVLLLATMPDVTLPRDPETQQPEPGTEEPTATLFTLGLDLSTLGPVQLRGLCLPGRLVMDLSVASLPDPDQRAHFQRVVDEALAGLAVPASLRLHWGRSPFMADLMPDGAAVTCDARA